MTHQHRWGKFLSTVWLGGLVLGSLMLAIGAIGSPDEVDVNSIFAPPSREHWLGTDSLGRDFFLRLLQGSGVSLTIAFLSILISTSVALIYGGIAGWLGRKYDWFMMIILDVWMSLPSGVLAAIVAMLLIQLSDSLFIVSLVIGLTHWGRLARLVRGEVMTLRNRPFVLAAKTLGASGKQILLEHIFPHLSSIMGISVIYQIPNLVLAESFLSFIGLGVQAPKTSWGILMQDGWRSLQVFPHVVFFPALFLFLTVLSIKTLVIEAEPGFKITR